jgi:RNA polymerase-interacting CarD/CdnL/TRCF family regulator
LTEAMTAGKRATQLGLAVGDAVVYGFHGVGLVAAAEVSAAHTSIVVEFPSGLRVSMPLELAHESLRALSNEKDLAQVGKTLSADESENEPQWARRFRAAREKLTAGEVTGLAEVVRDGARREDRLALRSGSTPSPAERDLYRRARQLLADEISAARGIDPLDADNWITEQIAIRPAAPAAPRKAKAAR